MSNKKRGAARAPTTTHLQAVQAQREGFDADGVKILKAHKKQPHFPPDDFLSWDCGNRALGRVVEYLGQILAGEKKRQPKVEMVWSTGTVRSHGDIRYPIFLGESGRENTRLMTHGFYSNGWTSHGTVRGCVFNFDAYRLDERLWGFTELGDVGASKIHRLHFESKGADGLKTGRKSEEWQNLRIAKLESGIVNLFKELAESFSNGYTFDDSVKKTKAVSTVPVREWNAHYTTTANRLEWWFKGVAPPQVVSRVEAAMGGKVPTRENLEVLLKV